MLSTDSIVQEHSLIEGAQLYCSPFFSLLIGCPPEILKVIFQKKLPMPDTIILPDELHKYHSSQANLEFPFYHFLFVQQGLAQGRKLRVFAKTSVCEHLKDLLRVTLLGPTQEEVDTIEEKLGIEARLDKKLLKQILKETHHLALKASDGHIFQIDEVVDFVPLEEKEGATLYPETEDALALKIVHQGSNQFKLTEGDTVFTPDLSIKDAQGPSYPIKDGNTTKEERNSDKIFTIRCIGSSDGFDPNHGANGYLFHFNGKWILWDAPAFTRNRLNNMGLELEDLDGIFLSHVHEDHLDPIETISEKGPINIYSSPEIYHCALIKLMAILECSYEEAQSHYNFHPIYANQPFDLFGATAEVFYSVHPIPALGLKLKVPDSKGNTSGFYLSGDHLTHRTIAEMFKAGVLSKERMEELEGQMDQFPDYDLIFMDAGGGLIHGDPSEYFDRPENIYYMHTGVPIKSLPKHHKLLTSGKRFILHH